MAAMRRRGETLPRTAQTITGGGGSHYLLRHPMNGRVLSRASGIADGVDVRADGGLIVALPSLHASGHRYRWHHSDPPAEAPAWLLDRISGDRRSRGGVDDGGPITVGRRTMSWQSGRNDAAAGNQRRRDFGRIACGQHWPLPAAAGRRGDRADRSFDQPACAQ